MFVMAQNRQHLAAVVPFSRVGADDEWLFGKTV